MKKLFSSPDSTEVELVKNMQADSGIVCEVRNGDVSRIVPAPSFYAELWVSETTYPKAAEVLATWQRPLAPSAAPGRAPRVEKSSKRNSARVGNAAPCARPPPREPRGGGGPAVAWRRAID